MDIHRTNSEALPPADPAGGDDRNQHSEEAWGLQALAFLERSRDVADEGIVDVARGETSTSEREADTRTRPVSTV